MNKIIIGMMLIILTLGCTETETNGEIYAYDQDQTITISGTGQANKVQITTFNTNGQTNGLTTDHTQDHIIINETGTYYISLEISSESAGGTAYEAAFAVFKNNGTTLLQNIHKHRSLSGGGGDTGSISAGGTARLTKGDTIEAWVWNETNTNNIVIDDITLTIIRISS